MQGTIRRTTVRRISTRTNTSLKKVETEQKTEKEVAKVDENPDAYIVKYLYFVDVTLLLWAITSGVVF